MLEETTKLFGTDGIRGVANTDPMTVEVALQLGRAAAYIFRKNHRRHSIVIGKDTRLSGYMFESALAAGICSMGVDVLLLGPLPTPGVAFMTRSLRADAGIVISASHNGFEDNGIKFFSREGLKLPARLEEQMEQLVSRGTITHIRPTAHDVGKAYRIDDALGRYVEFVKNSFPKGMTLDGLKIVLDCAHGAAYKAAPLVLKELGAQVFVYGNEPNGTNINKKCGSLFPEGMRQKVMEHHAHVGISLDGDADRVIFSDEKGSLVDGDDMMAICARDLFLNGYRKKLLVTTVMSNFGLDQFIHSLGGEILRTKVGDRFVIEEMLKRDALFGGEQSGHMIFRDFTTTGDGLISALQILRVLVESGKFLSELRSCFQRFPQVLLNIRVREKKNLEEIVSVKKAIHQANQALGLEGRTLVRYSGTEPIARVMIEGENQDQIQKLAENIAEAIEKELGEK
ncbi:MAG: phosphoglucosamine mutase [Chlamydiae bacterium]|nr:phosphoglucosamine mutase [Chlamydiota bacterium]MBI3278019.1 phosphoglucosamine mutase [Chlamydiota bacterium]